MAHERMHPDQAPNTDTTEQRLSHPRLPCELAAIAGEPATGNDADVPFTDQEPLYASLHIIMQRWRMSDARHYAHRSGIPYEFIVQNSDFRSLFLFFHGQTSRLLPVTFGERAER
jgi:hypothetical protein